MVPCHMVDAVGMEDQEVTVNKIQPTPGGISS